MKDVELASIIANSAPRMEEERLEKFKKDLFMFLSKFKDSKYFTLMGMPSKEGNSTRYVTLFNINKEHCDISDTVNEIYKFILENESSLGELKGFLKQDNYIEIWYGNECYLFFNFEAGVIEIGY